MWYVVDILFAQPLRKDEATVQCESCDVLFEAPSALIAYDKAVKWAKENEKDNNFKYVGIHHLYSLEEEQPGDGSEIGGNFFEEEDLWERVDEFIPDPKEIRTIKGEENPDVPIGDLMSEEDTKRLEKLFGEE
ncbi:MAG: hypothetical protein ACYS32_07820 [Planctomycetota bacterium]|jgi:hypothetical protein